MSTKNILIPVSGNRMMSAIGLPPSNSIQMCCQSMNHRSLFIIPSSKVAQSNSDCYTLCSRRRISLFCSTFQNKCETSLHSINERGSVSIDPVDDVSYWGKTIREFTDDGLLEDAIRVYLDMLECGLSVSEFRYFPCLIKAFGGLCDGEKGRQIHGHVIKLGYFNDIYVNNSLLSMYWKCGYVEEAIQLFEKMSVRDVVSWNAMIYGLCQCEDFMGSLMILRQMINEHGIHPNRVTSLSALSLCGSIGSLVHGKEIHVFLMKTGLDINEFCISGLIEMYMKCKDIRSAQCVFRSIFGKDSARGNAVLWNVMITGYISNGNLPFALKLFIEMLNLGIRPDFSTMVAILVLCSRSHDLKIGKQIHGLLLSFGLENDARVETALVEMYFNCGEPGTGLKIFRLCENRNLILWSAVISNCSQNGFPMEALKLFHDFMLEYNFLDFVIILAVLRACSSMGLKSLGMQIHGLAVKLRFDSDIYIGGALVDFHGKCADMESAQKVFVRLPLRDLISWNALIAGYSQNDTNDEALKAFREMLFQNIRPNAVTYASILSVCAQLSAFNLSKEIHGYLIRQNFDPNILVNNSLIATYSKCGDINNSRTIFEKMPTKNKVSWNSIILGLGMHGRTDEMFGFFKRMKELDIEPDYATFTALLSACSHTGKVDMGWKYFESMVDEYKLEPKLEHYTCMVDLLGRAGHLKEAYDLIMAMPCVTDDRIWGSLLGSCRSHGDKELAEVVAKKIFQLDPTSTGYRVLLANIYEDSGKLDEFFRIRSEIKEMGLVKQPGCSWIEVNNDVNVFMASDRSHSQSEEIYAVIEHLTLEMKLEGYIPWLQSVNT